MRIYTVEMFNEDVICMSYVAHSKAGKTYTMVNRKGFHDVYIQFLPEIKEKTENRLKYDIYTLQEISKPLIKWLNENCNPHMKLIIEYDRVELVSGECSFKNEEFIKD